MKGDDKNNKGAFKRGEVKRLRSMKFRPPLYVKPIKCWDLKFGKTEK